jgi:3-oxosteroid 1-dehydrogenase
MTTNTPERDSRLRVSRRGFLAASGAGATFAAASIGAIPFAQSVAAQEQGWDQEYDLVVVGSGGAGFAAAVTAHQLGDDVAIFEKGAYVGGTTLVSGGGMYIPDSTPLREAGIETIREDTLKYMARYSWPHLYQPEHETLGLPQHDYDMITTFYDNAAPAMDFIAESGAQTWALQVMNGIPENYNVDYMDQFPEDTTPAGNTVCPIDADGNLGGGGMLIANYVAWAADAGVPVNLHHRVERVVLNDAGAVVGVEISVVDPTAVASATPEASPVASQTITVRARKGVVFASGGFARNESLMHHLMPAPYYGGCSAPTNEGDFLRISSAVNAKLGNLHNVYRNEGIYEQAIADTGAYNCMWFLSGDSMMIVNKHGKRFVNEKRNYQDRPMAHLDWNASWGTWDNLLAVLVYDERVSRNWGTGFPYPADPSTTPYIISGDTLEDLAAAIEERFASLPSVTVGLELGADFATNFVAEVARFNEYAAAGVDPEFERGAFGYDVSWPSPPVAETADLTEWPSADQPNPAMYPISDTGPYYAFIVAASAVDTNGGPIINPNAQIVTWNDEPVVGLYGAGNCVASPGVNAYWGGGMTLGNAHVWGYMAAQHAHAADENPV